MKHLAFLFALLASPALAEIPFPEAQDLQAETGYLDIREGPEGQALYYEGRRVPGAEAYRMGLGTPFAYGQGEAVLVSLMSGGNACPSLFGLVLFQAEGRASFFGSFGSCSDRLLDLRVEGRRIEIDIGAMRAGIERHRVTFDGKAFTEEEIAISTADATPAGPGKDVRRWIGQHPSRPFEDASERLRFLTIMTETELNRLADSVSVATVANEAGAWVIGFGCLPHQCDTAKAGWAIRIKDGQPAAVIWQDGKASVFGLPRKELPPPLRKFARSGDY